MKKSKLLALFGALALTLSVAGTAFANSLSVDKPHMIDPTTLSELISDEGVAEDCSDFTGDLAVGEGEVGIHFILTTPEAETGNISGSVDGTAFGPVANTVKGQGNGAMHFYVVVEGDGDSVINEATTDVDGGVLTVSHLCFGGGSEPTPTPTFDLETAGITECPCDTDLGANTSSPADGAWLLVVALGVLLASIVVLTPARAKSRR